MRTMSDFEGRVRDALGAGADEAPAAVGLAEGARRRLRRRRVVTSAVAATAVVLAAVPVGLALVGSDDDGGPGRDDVEVADGLPEVPDGWRWESFRDVQVAVPGTWTGGNITQWCSDPSEETGRVDRGEGVSTLMLCEPEHGYGVVLRAEAGEPLTSTRGPSERVALGGAVIDVIAPDEATLQEIVGSAHVFEEVDSRGCRATVAEVGEGMLTGSPSGALTVCRYGVGSSYELQESRVLPDPAAADWLAALESTGEPAPLSEDCEMGAEAMLVSTADGPVAWLEYDACGGGYALTRDGEKGVSPELTGPLGSML